MTLSTTPTHIASMDLNDPLAKIKKLFHIPEGKIYLDGNSLGMRPISVMKRLQQTVEVEWGENLISSWNTAQWIDLPQTVGAQIAHLVGAQPNEVIAADTTSLNLFKVLSVALQLNSDRKKIISDTGNFPTDLYIAEGLNSLLKNSFELHWVDSDSILENLNSDCAVLMLTQVNFKTGFKYDIQKMTEKAHALGILVIWDLSHSAGAVSLELSEWNVDFAIGCGYKYLNGGPGAPAFLYVNKKHHSNFHQPLSGWMGHRAPFEFTTNYAPALGVQQALCGTPSILSLVALNESLKIWSQFSLDSVWEKSVNLTELFIKLMAPLASEFNLQLLTPQESALRGSHVSYSTDKNGYAIIQALISLGVIGDFRAPNVLRFGFTPLYTSYSDVYQAVEIFKKVLTENIWQHPQFQKIAKVT